MANILGITEMTAAQAQKYVTVNNTTKYLTTLMTGARDIIAALPTGIENACWIIGTAFTPYTQYHILFYFGGAFYSMAPVEGLALWVWDENCFYEYTGSIWQKRTLPTIPAAGNWKVFYSNGSAVITELGLGTTGQVLVGQGVSAAPIFGNLTNMITAGNWKIFHSNGSAVVTELTLPAEGQVLKSGGVAAAPAFVPGIIRLASVTVGMQTADGKQTIYTVPTGLKMIPTYVVVRNPTGSLAGGTEYDFGDGANCDNWKQNVDLSSMTATDDCRVISNFDANFKPYDAADVFGIKGITGSTGDYNATIELFGYLY